MAQEPRAESSAPASARPEGTAVPVEPASAAPWTGGEAAAENSGETRIPDKEWIEARHTAAKEAGASDDPASKALEDRYQEALDLYKTIEAQRALLDSYAAALTSAPEATNEARATMEATPQPESGADHGDPGFSDDDIPF